MPIHKNHFSLVTPGCPQLDDPQPLVIYHRRKYPDGFDSGLADWLFYTGKTEFFPLNQDDIKLIARLPALDGRAVYILDFSFSANKSFHA